MEFIKANWCLYIYRHQFALTGWFFSKGAFFILFFLNMLTNSIILQIWICCDFTLLLSTCICYLLNHTKTVCTCFQWLLSQWKCSITVPPLWVGKLRCWVSLKCNDYFYCKLVKVILYPLLFFYTVDAIWWHTFGKNVSVNDNEWCCVTGLGHVHCCCRRTGDISVNINGS